MFLVSPSFVAVPWQDSRKWQLCVRRGRDEVNGVSDITAADREHIKLARRVSLSWRKPMNVESTFSLKFLSASCGNAK